MNRSSSDMSEHLQADSQPFKIRMPIKYKILFSVILVVSMAVSAITYTAVRNESKMLHKSLIDKGQNLASNIASSTKSAFWSLNWIFVENLLKESAVAQQGDVIYTKIVKPNGEVYLANDQQYYGTLVDTGLLTGTSRIIQAYEFETQKGILLVHPVEIGKETWHILLGLSTVQIEDALTELVTHNSFWGAIFLAISVLVSLFLSHSISKPISDLARVTQAIADGARDQTIQISSRDETGLLGDSFNKMIHSIQSAENALMASNERFVTVLDSVDATIYVADINTYEILFMNQSMKNLFGSDLIGKRCYQVFRGESKPCPVCKNDALIDDQGEPKGVAVWEEENPVTKRWFLNYDRAIHWIDDRVVHLQIAFETTKIRELDRKRKEAEAMLRQSQKMEAIGKLAGGVAHDLNNVLSGIINYPELLLLDLPEDHDLREPIEEIKSSGERAATIVDDLLTLARRGVAVNEQVDINHLISQCATLPEYDKLLSFHPGVHLVLSLEEDLNPVNGSPVHMQKSIMNLISNAAEAMPEGGQIQVSTRNLNPEEIMNEGLPSYPNGYVLICVADQGVGIAKEEQEKIFEPFYTKKVMGRSGTGLGMAVVWGTVEDHGGQIKISSQVGQGTVFHIYLPASAREAVPADVKTIDLDAFQGNGETILVVDDVKEQREVAKRMLSRLGYTVAAVSSGEEAVAHVREHPVDLLVLDMIMAPGINGRQTYEQIVSFKPDQRAILASGFSESEDVKQTMHLGAGQYIKKPYSIEIIAQAVKRELSGPAGE